MKLFFFVLLGLAFVLNFLFGYMYIGQKALLWSMKHWAGLAALLLSFALLCYLLYRLVPAYMQEQQIQYLAGLEAPEPLASWQYSAEEWQDFAALRKQARSVYPWALALMLLVFSFAAFWFSGCNAPAIFYSVGLAAIAFLFLRQVEQDKERRLVLDSERRLEFYSGHIRFAQELLHLEERQGTEAFHFSYQEQARLLQLKLKLQSYNSSYELDYSFPLPASVDSEHLKPLLRAYQKD